MAAADLFAGFVEACQEKLKLFDWLEGDEEIRAYVAKCLESDETGWIPEIEDPLNDEDQKIMALHILRAAYRYDEDCIDGDEAYGHLIEEFARLTHSEFSPEELSAVFDDDDEEWTVTLTVRGHSHEFVMNDYGEYVANEELLGYLNQILEKESVSGRFCLVGSAEPTVMYLRPIQVELNRQCRFLPILSIGAPEN
jgi:hypothetical protein